MAEESEVKSSAVTETAEQPSSKETTSESLDGMLAGIPGLEKYFGAESEEEKEPAAEEPLEGAEVKPAVESEGQPEEVEKKAAELPPSVQKRIDKLTAQKHSALEKAEALEVKLKELESKLQEQPSLEVNTPDNPLGSIESADELKKRFSDAQRVKLWALENLDGGEVSDGKGGTNFMEGPRVRQLLALSEALLTQHIPQRQQYLQQKAVFEAETKKVYPNAFKAGTEESIALKTWGDAVPQIRKYPDFQLIIMDALAGQKMRLAKAAAANGQKQVRTPTLTAPSPSAGAKTQPKTLPKDLLARIATDRSALDMFSESLIGTGRHHD